MVKFTVKYTNKAMWHMAFWQNWCLGQLQNSKFEVLQNCSAFFVSVSLVGENLRGLIEYLTHKIRILIDCDTSSAASTAASTVEVTSPPIMQNRKQHLNKLKLALPLKQRLQIVADSSQVCYLSKQFDKIQY